MVELEVELLRVAAGAVVVLLAGCTAATPTSGPTPTHDACANASDLSAARDGAISAGPFKENRGRWLTTPTGTKLWVRSSIDQPPTTATVVAGLVDGTDPATRVTQVRDVDQVADVSSSGLFFPGALHLPVAGTWRLTVTIGQETGCFLFDAG